jgi:site-specific DNA recombinase
MGVSVVDVRVRVAHQGLADVLRDAGFHEPGVERVLQIMEPHGWNAGLPDGRSPRVFEVLEGVVPVEVTELLDRGLDVHVAHDGLDLRSRSGRLMGDIQAVLAADYSRNLREEVKKGLYGRMKQGLLARPAPLGYQDNGSGKPKTIDPRTGPQIRDLFERYATGEYSLRSLTREAVHGGLRGRRGRRVRQTQIADMLHNPFYAGVIAVRRTQQSFVGAHEPLVATAVFERVQRVLAGKAPRHGMAHDFLFRRLLVCAHCGRHLIGERQKGRVYYRCHIADCPTTTVREDVAESHVVALLSGMRFELANRAELRDEFAAMAREDSFRRQQRDEGLRLRLASVHGRLDRLTDAYLDGTLDKAELAERKTALLMERRELEDQRAHPGKDHESAASLLAFLELADRAYLLYEKALPAERRELIELLTSNRLVEGRTPRFTLASPFDELAVEAQKQSGGPSRSRARTEATVKRLLTLMSRFLVSSKASALCQRVHDVVRPNTADDTESRRQSGRSTSAPGPRSRRSTPSST